MYVTLKRIKSIELLKCVKCLNCKGLKHKGFPCFNGCNEKETP